MSWPPFCSRSGSASLSALQASSMAPHSIDDPLAMPKKRELSASVGFPAPSAILRGDETAASLRWSARKECLRGDLFNDFSCHCEKLNGTVVDVEFLVTKHSWPPGILNWPGEIFATFFNVVGVGVAVDVDVRVDRERDRERSFL